MKKRVFFGQNDLRFYYLRFKDSGYYSLSIIILTIFICIILLLSVVVPQVEKYFSIRNEVIAQREKIRIINENINFMNSLDKVALDSQLQTASRALPPEKDFVSILNAISDSAILSGVTIADYNFEVGEIASESAVVPGQVSQPESTIGINIQIDGGINGVKNFLKEMNEKLPLSEVESVDHSSTSTSVSIKFHYKTLPDISFAEDKPLGVISAEKKILLEKLALWQSKSLNQEFLAPLGSESGSSPLFE